MCRRNINHNGSGPTKEDVQAEAARLATDLVADDAADKLFLSSASTG